MRKVLNKASAGVDRQFLLLFFRVLHGYHQSFGVWGFRV